MSHFQSSIINKDKKDFYFNHLSSSALRKTQPLLASRANRLEALSYPFFQIKKGESKRPALKTNLKPLNENSNYKHLLEQGVTIGSSRRSQPVLSYFFNNDYKIINSLGIGVAHSYQPKAGEGKAVFNHNISLVLSLSEGLGLEAYSPKKNHWYLIEDLQKLLVSFFKSMYSLISKTKFKAYADKIAVEILYYIAIPDANIFSWYSIINASANSAAFYSPSPNLWLGEKASQPLQLGGGGLRETALAGGRVPSKKVAEETGGEGIAKLLSLVEKDKVAKKLIERLKRKNKLVKLLKKSIDNSKRFILQPQIAILPPAFSQNQWLGEGGRGEKIQSLGEKFFKLNLISINHLYKSKFNVLVRLFNFLFKKPIELELIRLHHSDSDSNILALLILLILKKKNIRSIINKIYNKNKVKDIKKMNLLGIAPKANNLKVKKSWRSQLQQLAYVSGLYIHIGGRLMREPIIPRITSKKFEKGAIAVGKVNSLEKTSITKKNKKGSYTINVIFAQNVI